MIETKRFIVWRDSGEGWLRSDYDTFDEAVDGREFHLRNGSYDVIVTEYVPLKVTDGREPPPILPLPNTLPAIPWWPNTPPGRPWITFGTTGSTSNTTQFPDDDADGVPA